MFTIMFPMDFLLYNQNQEKKKVTGIDDEDEVQPVFDNEDVQRDNWMAINVRWINETTPPNFEEVLKPFLLNTRFKI